MKARQFTSATCASAATMTPVCSGHGKRALRAWVTLYGSDPHSSGSRAAKHHIRVSKHHTPGRRLHSQAGAFADSARQAWTLQVRGAGQTVTVCVLACMQTTEVCNACLHHLSNIRLGSTAAV